MSWFKKKEGKDMLPDLPESKTELPKLPQIDSNIDAGMSSNVPPPIEDHDVIKNELTGNVSGDVIPETGMRKSNFEPLPHYESMGGVPAKIVAEPFNMQEKMDLHNPRTVEVSSLKTKKPELKSTRKVKPIYIRLDKFKEGLESFGEIVSKIGEIEDLLLKIKETREKEERELEDWEREIQIVKSRIEQIDNDVFGGLE